MRFCNVYYYIKGIINQPCQILLFLLEEYFHASNLSDVLYEWFEFASVVVKSRET